jgi:D-alanine-D-alanine ligase
MRIGIAYDLKTDIATDYTSDDALEEYDSHETVEMIADAIESRGHRAIWLGGGNQFLDTIRQEDVDFVFNISEGRGSFRSREAQVPSILEMLYIPYSGSDPQTLAVCLDKPLTKKIISTEGIKTPRWLVIRDKDSHQLSSLDEFRFPLIVKPAYEGSSKGVRLTSVTHSLNQVINEIRRLLELYHQPVMIEEFIDGDEVTVGITGNDPPEIVGVMRILPKNKTEHFVYSLEVKRDYLALVDYECPARYSSSLLNRIEEDSLKIFRTLGCRDFTRVDFRVSADGTPYFIEINPLPGLGTYSDLIIMAVKMARTHQGVIVDVLDAALKRCPQCLRV